MQSTASSAKHDRGLSWDDWSDKLADFCLSLADREDVFERLVRRIAAGDRLRRAARGNCLAREAQPSAAPPAPSPVAAAPNSAQAVDLKTLLAHGGRAFVEHACATLPCRPADTSGRQFYFAQMESGIEKAEILNALATSPEGRVRDVKLAGQDELTRQRRTKPVPLLKRIFGASKA